MPSPKSQTILNATVIVAALGYFVDIYDLLLFGIVRIPSLKDLGLSAAAITTSGEMIVSWQMWGLLIGGLLWGVIGDKKGRSSVLFGSIILYSLANIANGFVTTVEQYKWIRFIAGIGLAGELGAGITLVAEVLPKNKRGIGTSVVAGFGILGAVVAFFVKQWFDWRTCYFIGGGLGLCLLLLRIAVSESGMFKTVVANKDIARGNVWILFTNAARFKKYLQCVVVGMPIWFVIGILVTFSKEFGERFGIAQPIDPGMAIMFAYAGLAVGDVSIGLISQYFKSRKKALYLFFGLTVISTVLFFTFLWGNSASAMYAVCALLGFSTGFWAIFITVAAEQFGTNIRATVTTTVPNMVRGSVPVMILLFKFLREKGSIGYINGAIITAVIVYVLAAWAIISIQETYHKDLNYVEK